MSSHRTSTAGTNAGRRASAGKGVGRRSTAGTNAGRTTSTGNGVGRRSTATTSGPLRAAAGTNCLGHSLTSAAHRSRGGQGSRGSRRPPATRTPGDLPRRGSTGSDPATRRRSPRVRLPPRQRCRASSNCHRPRGPVPNLPDGRPPASPGDPPPASPDGRPPASPGDPPPERAGAGSREPIPKTGSARVVPGVLRHSRIPQPGPLSPGRSRPALDQSAVSRLGPPRRTRPASNYRSRCPHRPAHHRSSGSAPPPGNTRRSGRYARNP
jgi:hypothetical protein